MSALDALLPRPNISEAWAPELPTHLSAGSLKMWMRCREQWRRRYVLGEKERPGAALVWGSAHNFALVETNFAQKIESGTDLSVSDVQLAFAEAVDQRVERDGDEILWGDETASDVKDKGVALAAAYHKQVSPTVQPLSVEEGFSLDVPGVPVPVIGYMDVTEPERTIDLKTGGRREMRPDNIFQGRIYQLARPVAMEFHLATKTKLPAIYTPPEWPEFGFTLDPHVQARTTWVLQQLASDIAATYERFGPEQPWPGAFTYGWACDYCGFKPTCSYWMETPGSVSFANLPAGVTKLPPRDAVNIEFGTPPALPGLNESEQRPSKEPDRDRAPARSNDSGSLSAEADLLTRTLLEIVTKLWADDPEKDAKLLSVTAAVVANHDEHADDPAKHVGWLRGQIERAEAAA